MYSYFLLIENIILCLTVTGKANGAPPVKLVLVGSIPTPKFFSKIIKNFEGGLTSLFAWRKSALNLEGLTLLKKRDLHECHELFDLMTHPDVFPFVRHKATSYEEFLFMTKQTMEAEEGGEL